ncbi:contactin-associated protein-like 2 isoform X1 [Mus pahari]|uniref:contactin-associated protein-like 2 isoform X1 n=1 Tax=Mus pahari TaxID=10093 RepID=UPI00111482FB|nr:contactin-associated protein-like 2 isoform X1 [Mus pahari]
MVMSLRAGCRAALLLWILSSFICRAWTAPSTFQKCDEPLISALPHVSFSSSSSLSSSYAPGYAKINKRGGAGGWSPSDSDHYQWLQVDFGNRKQISAIATQGRYSSSDWVTQYRMLYSDTGRNWKPYHQDGNIWAFPGNVNSDSVVRHDLQHAVVARYIRIVPLDWNGEGHIGLRAEVYGCAYWADVINFDGHGVLPYRFRNKKMKTLKDVIALKFKTSESEGVLLHGEGQQGDYITLELKKAKLVLSLNLGSNQLGPIYGHTSVTSGSLLDDHHWHSVLIERQGRSINLTLDRSMQHFRTNGEFDYLDLDYEITFGGIPFSGKPSSSNRKNFKGCMESINYNGVNITDLARRKKLEPSNMGNLSFSCVEPYTVPVFFNATSYLEVPGRLNQDLFSVSFQFRTWNPSGLLLFSHFADNLGNVEIDLVESKVGVHINNTQTKTSQIDISSGSGLNDGQWHEVRFLAKENFAVLTIDGDEASAVRTNSPLQVKTGEKYFFGGFLNHMSNASYSALQPSFQGCMQLIQVDDQLVNLYEVAQRKPGSFANVTIDMCAIIDRCVPNHCEHGGKCSQTWDSFKCTCDETGYSGATCHNSIYEPSCEAYKHLGQTSNYYWIDPDGSGPLGPLKVYCNMTEDKVWTIVSHDLQMQTTVVGYNPEKYSVTQLIYSASMDQISAITSSAEYCEQYVSYFCRMSRLLNTPDGSPYTWWVGKANEKHYYWGGSEPGIQKCACGIERNCTDPKYYCNCDADYKQWRKDAGFLSYKDHLPVSQVVVGDTDRQGSEAKLSVGPLRCQGDRNYWNAASFPNPSSYLHFSTFQGETSADISFYFKTLIPRGVFLENLGNTDFIKLELKSATEVSFSFDVGNGPVEIVVRSPSPLNDDQWHRVTAERNVKQASLQVDRLPQQIRKAPTEGHTRLELYSQLFVGGAGGQQGFLGCIRSLRMNGVTLDLEERAKVTSGFKSGCSGHCTSYGANCENGGKCIEKYHGYSCDCSNTAYDGTFCNKDVGAFFEEGMWLRYNFQAPAVTARDTGSRAENSADQQQHLAPDLAQEQIHFSFSTTKAPCILLYVSSLTTDFLAVLVKPTGNLQIRYNLGGTREPFNIDVDHRNMANGQPHSVNITRHERTIILKLDHYPAVGYHLPSSSDTLFNSPKSLFLGKVIETGKIDQEIHKYNTPGFTGCLSRVQFNHIAPLKAALRQTNASAHVHIQGELVESNCGASPLTLSPMSSATDPWHLDHLDSASADFPYNPGQGQAIRNGVNRNSAIIGGVIAVVIFTILCTLVFLIRYMFRHKGTYHTNEAKGAESAESADAAIMNNDPNFTETIDESKKEWLI